MNQLFGLQHRKKEASYTFICNLLQSESEDCVPHSQRENRPQFLISPLLYGYSG